MASNVRDFYRLWFFKERHIVCCAFLGLFCVRVGVGVDILRS